MRPAEQRVLIMGRPLKAFDPLRQRLEAEGFAVVALANPEDAVELRTVERPDIVLLDLQAPATVLEALAVCRRIRRAFDEPQLPVLVLDEADERIDKATVLEHGADDVMSRPYEPRELFARIRALLRRHTREPSRFGVLSAGPIELDLDRYTVMVEGRPLALTPKEFELLRELIEARGRVVRREVVLERVWHYGRNAGVESRTLDVHIRRLRKKLGPESSRIVTVRNVGYRMDLSPSWVLQRRRTQGGPK